jgi:NAD+--dinitrogen-reductase ADP-D-ribosyltransferase
MLASPFNLCNLPPWAIASRNFNRHPQPLEIQGVRQSHQRLFDVLDRIDSRLARGQQFHDYMDVLFQLHQWQSADTSGSRKSLKNSYLRFLRGWMFDSNSREGAVLKGWVESRLGLPPTFHNGPINDLHGDAYQAYLAERMQGVARTSALMSQFDLLYEFVQDELRRSKPVPTHLRLWRGIHDFNDQRILEKLGGRRHLVRLNNLVSFTTDFERAWEFGSKVLQADVPLPKVFFCGDLLPAALFKGEGEVMVVGGEYEVDVLIGG